ncbi:MAG: Na+/H+ antiporter NhaA [Streptosporangiales bacterium]|nr:Na+/H+ antiporter NhaA [Streptosporangiales bacterium]
MFPARQSATAARHLAEALRTETVGGTIMLVATVTALVWANSPWAASYAALTSATVGPSAVHLDLTLHQWAADGLLAIFFAVAGLEVKRELVVGELRHPASAALPVISAVAGMAVPALVFLAVSAGTPGAGEGWAIPMATDIAFALAVLAVTGSRLPVALRVFLLTLAVVDDLGAIAVIAVFYTEQLNLVPLLGAAVLLAAYGLLQRYRVTAWFVYVPIAVVAWALVHESGVHATVAGVAVGLLTRVRVDPGEAESPADRLEHRLRPVSAGFAVPAFALLAAGVPLSAGMFADLAADRVALGVVAGLLVGKIVGVLGGAWLSVRLGLARLGADLNWGHLAAVSLLAGIGFTVSLLIGELAYGGTERIDLVKASVLLASFAASVLAAILLRVLTRRQRRAAA